MITDPHRTTDQPNPSGTVALPALHHIALTVTDLDTSVPWYEDVFGIRLKMDVPHPGGVGRLLADEERSLIIVLHRHESNDGASFRETATGLDHVGFVSRPERTSSHGKPTWRPRASPDRRRRMPPRPSR